MDRQADKLITALASSMESGEWRKPGRVIDTVEGVQYSIVSKHQEVDAILRFRYHILVDKEGSFPENGIHLLVDEYDFSCQTTLIQAHHNEALVGTLRLIANGPVGLPSEKYFDLHRAIEKIDPESSQAS